MNCPVKARSALSDSEDRLLQPARGLGGDRGFLITPNSPTWLHANAKFTLFLSRARLPRSRAGEAVAAATEVAHHSAGSNIGFRFLLSQHGGCKHSGSSLVCDPDLEPRV